MDAKKVATAAQKEEEKQQKNKVRQEKESTCLKVRRQRRCKQLSRQGQRLRKKL